MPSELTGTSGSGESGCGGWPGPGLHGKSGNISSLFCKHCNNMVSRACPPQGPSNALWELQPPSNLEWGQSVQLLAVTQTWISRWWGPTEQEKGLGSSANSRAAPGRGQEPLPPHA